MYACMHGGMGEDEQPAMNGRYDPGKQVKLSIFTMISMI